MQVTVYNPQKGRLEAIDIEYGNNNTIWFGRYKQDNDISSITDFQGKS